jgi:virulence-associated protein VapD
MIKMQILMDEKKILREKKYDINKIYAFLDEVFVSKCGLKKGTEGFYFETGTNDDLALFAKAIRILERQEWFLQNVDTWLLFDSTDRDNPNDFIIEDAKAYYQTKYRISA